MIRLAYIYALLRHWTWVRAGWQLGAIKHWDACQWAHRSPSSTWTVEAYWDGAAWRARRLLSVEDHA